MIIFLSCRIYDICESVPGADVSLVQVDVSRSLTIHGKSPETVEGRILIIECFNIENRNTLLTGLR